MKRLSVFGVLFVFFVLSFAAAKDPPRIVTVTLLLDGTDDVATSLGLVRAALREASLVFQKDFGIKFKLVEFSAGRWFAPSDYFDCVAEFRRIERMPRKSDILLVFTTKSFFRLTQVGETDGEPVVGKESIDGVANIFKNNAIVRIAKRTDLLLLHELGHIFGARHSPDESSVMHEDEVSLTTAFDNESKEVINANRNRKF